MVAMAGYRTRGARLARGSAALARPASAIAKRPSSTEAVVSAPARIGRLRAIRLAARPAAPSHAAARHHAAARPAASGAATPAVRAARATVPAVISWAALPAIT